MPGGGAVRVLPVATDVSTRTKSRSHVWLVVSTVPETTYGQEAVERGLQDLEWVAPRALAHEAVVEYFLGAPAVLPMQLFTLFAGDERALDHVRRNARRIERILERIDRQVEWGLRLTWNPDAPADAGRGRRPARAGSGGKTKAAPKSGAAYLALKREQRDLSQARLEQARSAANRLYRAVSRTATAARRRSSTERAAPGSRLLLDAAFLVPAPRSAAFRKLVDANSRKLEAAGLTLSLTGPWPAYNFV
jgi:hypothetical protein